MRTCSAPAQGKKPAEIKSIDFEEARKAALGAKPIETKRNQKRKRKKNETARKHAKRLLCGNPRKSSDGLKAERAPCDHLRLWSVALRESGAYAHPQDLPHVPGKRGDPDVALDEEQLQ
eukprot:9468677-Pyramimonas_sp.AAC.1